MDGLIGGLGIGQVESQFGGWAQKGTAWAGHSTSHLSLALFPLDPRLGSPLSSGASGAFGLHRGTSLARLTRHSTGPWQAGTTQLASWSSIRPLQHPKAFSREKAPLPLV